MLVCLALGAAPVTAGTLSPFAAVQGTYFGLFTGTDKGTSPSAGGFTFTTTYIGSLSGVWQMGAERLAVSGHFDTFGHFSKTIVRPHQTPITLTLQLDMSAATSAMTGSVSNGVWTAVLTGHRGVFDGLRQEAPQAGRYTLIIPGDCAASNAPCGDSYGTLSVSKRGAVRLSGVLADGTRFTQATGVSADGQWPLYAPLYGRNGWLWSWLAFSNPPAGDLGGELSWIKPPIQRAKYYGSGFALTASAQGSAFVPVGRNTPFLHCTNISLVLSGGALAAPLSISGQLRPGNWVQLSNQASLNFSAATGTFRGSALDPATHKRIAFGGVVLQRQDLGCGCFLGQAASGRVRFGPANAIDCVAQLQTLGQSFAPRVDTDGARLKTFYWTWADATFSFDHPSTTKDFGSMLPRQQSLTAYPPEAVLAINLGFDGADGGESTPLPLQPPQNVGAVYFPTPLPGLRYWASAYNPITNTLDFTGFNRLEYIECFSCTNLQHTVAAHLPALRRACFETCALQELDLSGDPNLEDMRGALNQFTHIVLGGGTGPKIWHWCTRDNPQLAQHLQDLQTNFFSLQECFMWNDNQSGALTFVSTNLTYVDVHHNQYSSADFSGQAHLLWCQLYDNQLTNLVFTTGAGLQVLDAHQNQLPPPVLDHLLELLDTTAPNLTEVDLSQNAGPISSVGYVHYLNLLNRGVSVKMDF